MHSVINHTTILNRHYFSNTKKSHNQVTILDLTREKSFFLRNHQFRPSFFGPDLAMDSPDYYKSVGMNLDELLAMEFSSITIGKDLDTQK
jgi:hypothetical protein